MSQLSTQTIHKLADALAPAVVHWLIQAEYLTETIPPFIDSALQEYVGELDPELHCELSCAIFERICLTSTK